MVIEKIKRLCKERKTTLKKINEDLGFGKNSISRWETNKPSIDKVAAVADYLGTTVDDLLKE